MVHLLICQTPLHVLIAREMVKTLTHLTFQGVYAPYVDNAKHRHYAQELASFCQRADYLVMTSVEETAAHLETLKTRFPRLSCLYFASLDSPLALGLLSHLPVAQVVTFDDGSANVFSESFYTIPSQETPVSRRLGLTWTKEDVLAKSSCHYTIYDPKANLFPEEVCQPLNLSLSLPDRAQGQKKERVTLFLGQLVSPHPRDSQVLMTRLIKDLEVDLYFPHPRNPLPLAGVETVETDLVLEDYIGQLLADYEEVRIYHFYSTLALNLKGVPGVTCLGIYLPHLHRQVQQMVALGCDYIRLAERKNP